MVGLVLNYPHDTGNLLWRIFQNVNYKDCNWRILRDEVYSGWSPSENSWSNDHLFGDDCDQIFTGEEFGDIINGEYWVWYLEFEAFPPNVETIAVYRYSEFIKSDCFLTFSYDRLFAVIYCKSEDVLNNIINTCVGVDITLVKQIDSSEMNARIV